jgi:hypothetical protein
MLMVGNVYLFNPTLTGLTVTINSQARSAENFILEPTSKANRQATTTEQPVPRSGNSRARPDNFCYGENFVYVFPDGADEPTCLTISISKKFQIISDFQIYFVRHPKTGSFGYAFLYMGTLISLGFEKTTDALRAAAMRAAAMRAAALQDKSKTDSN